MIFLLSRVQIIENPVTGEVKKKTKLGGAYPGQRPAQHQPYRPPANDFGADGKATLNFVAYGGGNALKLVEKNDAAGSVQQPSSPNPDHIQVTLPYGVKEGQTIHVKAPDGRLNAIVIPPGLGPGSTFTVEFASEEKQETNPVPVVQADDSNYYGTTTATPTAIPVGEPEIAVDATPYGYADAYAVSSEKPVYSSTPQYPSK